LTASKSNKLISGSTDQKIIIWNIANKYSFKSITKTKYARCVNVLNEEIACFSTESTDSVSILSLSSYKSSTKLQFNSKLTVYSMVFLSNKKLACGTEGKIFIWNLDFTKKIDQIFEDEIQRQICSLLEININTLASGTDDGSLMIWNLKNNTKITELKDHSKRITSLAKLNDSLLVSGSLDSMIIFWDLKTYQFVNRIEQGNPIKSLAILLDSRIAIGFNNGTIAVYDYEKRTKIMDLNRHSKSVNSLVVLNDGHLASGSDDNTIIIWK
jgi:WD40 repeat protein